MPSTRIAILAAIAAAVAHLVCAAALALAQTTQPAQPRGELHIGDETFPISFASLDAKTFLIGPEGGGLVIETPAALVVLTGVLNPDPQIDYALTVTSISSSPLSIGLFMTLPIVPTGSPNDVFASLSGALTDGAGDGVSLTPFNQPLTQLATVGTPDTSIGVDVGTAVTGPPTGVPASPTVYGPFDAGPLPGPAPGPWTTLATATRFTLSPNDSATLVGSASIIVIPSPALASPAALFLLTLRRRGKG